MIKAGDLVGGQKPKENSNNFNDVAAGSAPYGPLPDPNAGISIPLNAVMKIALRHADIVHVGDTEHRDARNSQLIARQDTLTGFAEAGAAHLFIELPQKMQATVDDLAARRIDTAEFEKKMTEDLNAMGFSSDKRAFMDMIERGGKVGLSVHCADPDTGKNAVLAAAYMAGVAGRDAATVDEMTENFMENFAERNDRANVTAALMGISRDEAENLWRGDASVLQARLKETLANASKMDPGAAEARLRDALVQRTADDGLAAFVAGRANGEKGVIFYGDDHGGQKNDFNEKLAALGVPSLKVSVYADRAAYEKEQAEIAQQNKAYGTHFGEDPPELIYIESEHKLYTTAKTPPDLAADLRAGGVPAAPAPAASPAPAPQKIPAPPAA